MSFSKGKIGWPVRLVCAVGLLLLAGCRSRPPVEPPSPSAVKEQPIEVTDAIDPEKKFDHRPYEFIWHEPAEQNPPLFNFDRPLGWSVTTEPGCFATFERTQEEQLWGSFVGKIVYGGASRSARAVIRPPEPIPIRDYFNTVTLWMNPGTGTLQSVDVDVSLLVRDAAGHDVTLPFETMNWDGWRLCYQRPPVEALAEIEHPCFLVGLEVRHGLCPEPRVLYLDSLAFFTERMAPLPTVSQRPLNLAEPPATNALPFPVSSRGVVPEFDPGTVRSTLSEKGLDHYVLGSRSPSGSVAYHVLLTNQMPLVRAVFNEVPVGDWFVGGGIHGTEEMHRDLVVSRVENQAVRLEYASGATYSFAMVGPSLCIDVSCRAGSARYVDSGGYQGQLNWQSLDLPELAGQDLPVVFGWLDPSGASTNHAKVAAPLFFSQVGDWYRSQSSAMQVVQPGAMNPGHVQAFYHKRTNGTRNDIRERFVLTLSPKIQEVLPSIANPASVRVDDLRTQVWAGSEGVQTFESLQKSTEYVAGLAMTNVVQGHPAVFWQGVGEDTTLRARATPSLGGDEALKNLLQAQERTGWRTGLQMNYLEISALNRYWSSDVVLRDDANRWRQMPSGRYGVKPGLSLRFQSEILPKIKASFSPSLSYTSELTTRAPWRMTDYDERAELPGMFAVAYARIGELLLEEGRQLEVPVIGDSGGEWFYAGLADAFVDTGHRGLIDQPYLPLLSLYRLHPLSLRYGMGPMSEMTGVEADDPAALESALDRYLSGQLAYGHSGRLAPRAWGESLQMRSYFTMQRLQARIAGSRIERMAYSDGKTYASPSEALVSGTWKASRLYVLYEGGVELWVNGNPRDAWEVRIGRDVRTLPPYGWFASGPDLLAASVMSDGHRVDFVRSPDEIYYDGRGSDRPAFGLASTQPVVATLERDDEKDVVVLFTPTPPDRIGLGSGFGFGGTLDTASVLDRAGRVLEKVAGKADGQGMTWYQLPPKAYHIRITCVPAPEPENRP